MRLLRPAALLPAVVVAAALASAVPAAADSSVPARTVRQVGTYGYLSSPDYTGLMSARVAAAGLTLGLGTWDRLDGELVLVGGTLYRVGTDGTPTVVDDDRTTPFFEGIDFHPTASGPVAPGTTCANLGARINEVAGTASGLIAVRVRGTFSDLQARSVSAQPLPYPTLATAVAGQTVFPLPGRRAVLVGFWSGPQYAGVAAPGLHLHGVTADRTAGGHVLSCVAGGDVQLSVEPVRSVDVLH